MMNKLIYILMEFFFVFLSLFSLSPSISRSMCCSSLFCVFAQPIWMHTNKHTKKTFCARTCQISSHRAAAPMHSTQLPLRNDQILAKQFYEQKKKTRTQNHIQNENILTTKHKKKMQK